MQEMAVIPGLRDGLANALTAFSALKWEGELKPNKREMAFIEGLGGEDGYVEWMVNSHEDATGERLNEREQPDFKKRALLNSAVQGNLQKLWCICEAANRLLKEFAQDGLLETLAERAEFRMLGKYQRGLPRLFVPVVMRVQCLTCAAGERA